MLQITEHEGWREIAATEGYLHRKGTDSYSESRRSTMLPSDTIDDFEELTELPAYTKAEYDAKVAELVRRHYTADEEFALQRKMLNATMPQPMALSEDDSAAAEAGKVMAEYAEYNAYVERCKADAPAAIAEEKMKGVTGQAGVK